MFSRFCKYFCLSAILSLVAAYLLQHIPPAPNKLMAVLGALGIVAVLGCCAKIAELLATRGVVSNRKLLEDQKIEETARYEGHISGALINLCAIQSNEVDRSNHERSTFYQLWNTDFELQKRPPVNRIAIDPTEITMQRNLDIGPLLSQLVALRIKEKV